VPYLIQAISEDPEPGMTYSMFYNEKVLEHFLNPRNVGEIADADGVGTIGDPTCGDYPCVFG